MQMSYSSTSVKKIKFLVIDDSKTLQYLISFSIKNANNQFDVISCSSGTEGIEKAIKEQPQLIFIDMIMPGMGGFETWSNLKKNPETKDIPIIMMKPPNTDFNIIKVFQDNKIEFIDKNIYEVEKFSLMFANSQ
jgi:CheY-like chemotaxis protein